MGRCVICDCAIPFEERVLTRSVPLVEERRFNGIAVYCRLIARMITILHRCVHE